MNREEVLYVAPYLISLFLSFGITLYAWRQRNVRSARAYTIFVAGQTASILGFILELISPNLEIKLLWDKFQWLTETFIVIVAFLLFSTQFAEHKIHHPKIFWGFWLVFPVAFTALLLTDNLHHLIYPNPHLSTAFPFPELQYDFTPVVYLYTLVYSYGATIYGLVILIRRAFQPHNLYRRQFLTVAIGIFLPLFATVFALVGIKIAPQRDAAPLSFAVGNLIIAWGLFRYRLFDLIPIAREHIVENMNDPIIVLDAKNRVVDMNLAALKILGKDISQVIGRPSGEVFGKWPAIVSELEYLDMDQREISFREGGDTFFYDVNVSSIYNNTGKLISRIVVARDVTKYKTLESGYRLLSEELEQRVRERTEELRHSAERYRAVVENQTEFIVRWKPDGTRTFVNEAYCRYWGLTYDQALSSNVMSHLANEDRHTVEEKISRLTSGAISSETETHRVIRPDGSIGWQEWTDQAILDEFGQVVEFQSVGRDITERKQAEENLAEAYERTLEGWAKALELRDKETEGHSRRVTETTLVVARAMNVDEEDLIHIRHGALLHDIGKMAIPDEILRKPGALTEPERQVVMQHPQAAYDLLVRIPHLKKALDIPYCHHEKWDGTGYPRGLKGEAIPLGARIFAVVDVWDALSNDRPYRGAWSKEKVAQYLHGEAGNHFDPTVVKIFLQLLGQGKI